MALVTIPARKFALREEGEIAEFLAPFGIDYERWTANREISPDAEANAFLEAYANEIEKLKAKGGYVTADVIDVNPNTPGLDTMLERFKREHWHDEDEVRFIVKGHGLFHIAPAGGNVIAIEMEAGDLIRVPRGTLHWFNLCGDRTVRAIRLFQDPSGWTPHYTESGVDTDYQPLCLGTSYFPLTSPLR
jgi:1,2-dihydroxy-3-keto-5-methylthiopentene dioxygenase